MGQPVDMDRMVRNFQYLKEQTGEPTSAAILCLACAIEEKEVDLEAASHFLYKGLIEVFKQQHINVQVGEA